MTTLERLGCGLLAVAALAGSAGAQDKPRPREFSTDIGFLSTSGNTDVTAFNLGERLVLRAGRWEHRQQFGSVYGAKDGKQTSNLLFVNARSDYLFAPKLGVFAYVGFDRDQFAGIARRFEEALGLSWRIVASDIDRLTFEAGYAQNQQRGIDSVTTNFTSLRTMSSYTHQFSKDAKVYQSVEYLPDLDQSANYRVNSETGLTAPLSAHLNIKISYVVRFDNVPEPTKVKSDRILTSGLQFNW